MDTSSKDTQGTLTNRAFQMLHLELGKCLKFCMLHSPKTSTSPVQGLVHPITNVETSLLSLPLPSAYYCVPMLCNIKHTSTMRVWHLIAHNYKIGSFQNWWKFLCLISDFLVESKYLRIQSAEKMHYNNMLVICRTVHISHKHVLYSQLLNTYHVAC